MPSAFPDWSNWQYSDSGSVPGIRGAVDLDRFNGSAANLDTFAGHLYHYVCKFGVEMPITSHEGPISDALAQRIAADCANLAAHSVLSTANEETPLGLACEEF